MLYRILFVDDEINILKAMERMLREKKKIWDMHFVQSVDQALSVLEAHDIDVVISDISMPGRDGFDLLSSLRDRDKTADIPVLILTGLNENSLKRKALDLGATDLLNKPWIYEDLLARINSMLRLKKQQDEIKKQNRMLDQKVKERTAELEMERLELIWRLGRAAEYRDTDTGNHVIRVGYYCKVLAENLGMDSEFVQKIFLTSPLHDIGKIGIPDAILLKQGGFERHEWEIMKRHCEIGGDILRKDTVHWSSVWKLDGILEESGLGNNENPFLKMAETIALTHHERWDGKGYPLGLSKQKVPIVSRITAIADVYDALSSKRPYKSSYDIEKVVRIMKENNGTHFDPEVFRGFEKSLTLFNDIRDQFADKSSLN